MFKERLNELYMDWCKNASRKTINGFATVLGLNRATVSYYLNGDRVPDARTLFQICEKLSVSADWLLGISDFKSPDHDFHSACMTLGISEKAGKNIKDNTAKSGDSASDNKINEFLEMDFWPAILTNFKLYLINKDQLKTEGKPWIELGDSALLLNASAAMKFLAEEVGRAVADGLRKEIENPKVLEVHE